LLNRAASLRGAANVRSGKKRGAARRGRGRSRFPASFGAMATREPTVRCACIAANAASEAIPTSSSGKFEFATAQRDALLWPFTFSPTLSLPLSWLNS
jgi:hypothetical protein